MKLASIQSFVSHKKFALAGVSATPQKFGNTIYKELTNKGIFVQQVHPKHTELNGAPCVGSIAELDTEIKALIIVTKPENTIKLVEEALAKGITHFWFQQGSYNEVAVKKATDEGATVIAKRCILMFTEPVKSIHKFHRGLTRVFGGFPK